MHGPAAEALLEGAECGTETEDLAGSSDVAAAAGMRPPRPVDWEAAGAAKDRQMDNASAEAAMTAGGGAAEDRPEAAAEAETFREGPPAKPADWPTMTKRQLKNYKRGGT